MSQFDKYTESEYVQAMRIFLGMRKVGFCRAVGLVAEATEVRNGRLPMYSKEGLAKLEAMVNAKASLAEADGTTFGQRYHLARDYRGWTDAEAARNIGVSRELVRRWGLGLHKPRNYIRVAAVMNVPVPWLEHGGEHNLAANSHIGVRVGEDSQYYRERLYSMTFDVLSKLPDGANQRYVQAFIEYFVKTTPDLSIAARRAGGRWQLEGDGLVFAPWIPIREHGLSRRFWTDEVELMIEHELASNHSVYAAWHALKARCDRLGLAYPRLITLHKRQERKAQRELRFGKDLNGAISYACAMYGQIFDGNKAA